MKEIFKISDIVRQVLKEEPQTRNSDTSLYLAVCRRINPDACMMSFSSVFEHRKELGIPNMETVRRSRQHLQEKYEELRACEAVTDGRYENWKVVREYAAQ